MSAETMTAQEVRDLIAERDGWVFETFLAPRAQELRFRTSTEVFLDGVRYLVTRVELVSAEQIRVSIQKTSRGVREYLRAPGR